MVAEGFKLTCLEPVIYRRNSDGIPTILYPCGKCIVCKEKKRREWASRMESEKYYSKSVFFVTLTYSDDNLYYKYDDCPASLNKSHYQSFLKSLRKLLPFPVRMFGVGEYGSESFRPHYHFMFFLPVYVRKSEFYSACLKCWNKGFITVKDGSVTRMYYIAKYTVKGSDHPLGTEKPFQTSSINPPIGYKHFNINKGILDSDFSINYYVSPTNRKSSIPRSFERKYKDYLDSKARGKILPLSETRKNILQQSAGRRLQDYKNKFNQLTPNEFMDMRDNIERRYYKKHKKITNI